MHASPPPPSAPTRTRARSAALAFQPPAGSYPTGIRTVVGEWDASAWTGRGKVDAEAGSVPAWKVRPFAFLAHVWFWMLVVGVVLVQTAGSIGSDVDTKWWLILAGVGIVLVMSAIVLFFQRLMRFHELPNFWTVVLMGVVSAVVANGVAVGLEAYLEPAIGMPFALDLWLAGVVEESAKLLVPFLLLVWAPRRFGDPRAGLLMVLISSAGFGVWEAISYLKGSDNPYVIVANGVDRSTGEIPHALWAGFAACLIWLAAHRLGRAFTTVGLVGWLIAAAQHSIHDGILSIGVVGTRNTSHADFTADDAGRLIILGGVYNLVWIVIGFFLLRYVARELVPPTAIAHNPPRWRPRLRGWGVSRREAQG